MNTVKKVATIQADKLSDFEAICRMAGVQLCDYVTMDTNSQGILDSLFDTPVREAPSALDKFLHSRGVERANLSSKRGHNYSPSYLVFTNIAEREEKDSEGKVCRVKICNSKEPLNNLHPEIATCLNGGPGLSCGAPDTGYNIQSTLIDKWRTDGMSAVTIKSKKDGFDAIKSCVKGYLDIRGVAWEELMLLDFEYAQSKGVKCMHPKTEEVIKSTRVYKKDSEVAAHA